jgi:Kef-type K+ transport system membrane component KefB
MMDILWLASAVWIGLALVSALISIRLALSVALIEIMVGAIGGNLIGLPLTPWVNYLAGFGAILLTFLAGAEVDMSVVRRNIGASVGIGFVSFLLPYLGCMLAARYLLGWPWPQAQIAGISLSTTSVAVVYAVMVETGLNKTDLGKLILTACFVCDLGTVLSLGILFANYNALLIAFGIATAIALVLLPWSLRLIIRTLGHAVSEPEVKYVFLLLLALGGLAAAARSEAVLPAYLLGLVAAGTFQADPRLAGRIRGTAFSFLTPFFFLKAGTLIVVSSVLNGIGAVAVLFGVKMITKVISVFPATRAFRIRGRQAWYTTMMMSTGLTFGSISALFGLTHGYIDRDQYSILVTVVVLTALLPTLIGQVFFYPRTTGLVWKATAESKGALEEVGHPDA